MSVGLPPTGRAIPPLTADPRPRPPAARRRADDFAPIPAGPPPELLAEVRAAARCADRLHELGRELRFERDPRSGRIAAELRDLHGNVLRRIPLADALDVARGAEVD